MCFVGPSQQTIKPAVVVVFIYIDFNQTYCAFLQQT